MIQLTPITQSIPTAPRHHSSGTLGRHHVLRALCVAACAALTTLASAQSETAPTAPPAPAPPAAAAAPVFVLMETSSGDVILELNGAKAPISVENFLQYVDDGFYDGTIFHRVIPTFMIQGGGFTADMQQKRTRSAIRNEWTNGLTNDRGTIAMARLPNPDSATSQFFINVKDNPGLNGNPQTGSAGYAVFGKVVGGMDVVDAIKAVPTKRVGGHEAVPVETVLIEKTTRLTPEEAKERIAASKKPADSGGDGASKPAGEGSGERGADEGGKKDGGTKDAGTKDAGTKDPG